ncbi:methyltransferase [Hirsutella rhossiliensis]|uniref:Methyltransferase domain-containing protein n=1 Tax=Hirsutella rhossiliensis TaxID=111463 RepID=A0A9P8SHY1_9HYPO|nr:methyltransferase domain-containing protein [Hirsutella rhossiliensis]KAH0961476.1 methyltransferase domain-containing protein [Hirsutella rhossiliensis]
MENRWPGSRQGDEGGNAHPDLRNFQFTFDRSSMFGGAENFIEPDPLFGPLSESASLSDSVQNFPEEFGRTYHAYRAGSYAFPNDSPEQERLVHQGQILKRLFKNRLYFAPLSRSKPPRNVLDVATGVGDWAIDMGDLFPNSQVIATDLSPIQPDEVPPNVKFYVEDSSDPWEYSHQFDYIHTRATSGCWSSFEKEVVEQAFATLDHGGWFEAQEFDCIVTSDDGTLDPNGPFAKWLNELTVAAETLHRPIVFGTTLKEVFERVGFVDVQQRIFKLPINGWAKDERLKELGRMWERNLTQGLSGFSFQLLNRAYDRPATEIEVSLVDVRRELADPRIHAYIPVFVVWGRKPYPGEVPVPTPCFQ